MSTDSIWTQSAQLKIVSIHINDIEIIPEDLISVEIQWNLSDFAVQGYLEMKDTYDLMSTGIFDGTAILKIYAEDLYGEKFYRKFKISGISTSEYNERFRLLNINFVEDVFNTLNKLYRSKGFKNKTYTEAFESYLLEHNIDEMLSEYKITKELEDSIQRRDFVVSQDVSVLDFFNRVFRNEGYRLYQERNKIILKEVNFNELPEAEVDGNILDFSNNTSNNYYGFKIHDFKVGSQDTITMNAVRPVIKHFAYDINSKTMNTETENLETIYESLKLNNADFKNIQQTIGEKYSTDFDSVLGKQKMDIEDVFLKNNNLEIVVPGNFKYNKLGYIVNVTLKGNIFIVRNSSEGDVINSGRYFISSISDKIVGDKMIQKIILNRVDAQNKR